MTRPPQLSPRTLMSAAIAAILLAAGAGTALAGGRYGHYGGSKAVPDCPAYTLVQPFLRWLDPGHYFLAPGGSFESGLTGWTVTGGAKIASGNESYHVNAPSDAHSLSLPPGSSVTSPSVCVTLDSPDLRLFVQSTGSLLSTLRVDMTYTNLLGRPTTATVGLLTGASHWSPSLPVLFLQDVLPQVGLSGQSWVSFTLTPSGPSGKWSVDDFYVDPLKNH
jgi:hypothetical protein